MLEVRDTISEDIFYQLPAIFREEGQEITNLLSLYYAWLDEVNPRDIPKIGDIDSSLKDSEFEKYLIFFKEKYLKDFPIKRAQDGINIPFLVKHITDLYQRKGTEEGLRLLFRLLFNEEIEIFYPSASVLRISDSIWSGENYLEMYPVVTQENYPIKRGQILFGNTSKARATVDDVIFIRFRGPLVPIVFVSSIDGEFIVDETFTIQGTGKFVGRIYKGSVRRADVLPQNRVPGQQVGDIVKLISNKNGLGAEATVTEVSTAVTGIIKFRLVESGYGYLYGKWYNPISPDLGDYPFDIDIYEPPKIDGEYLLNEIIISDQVAVIAPEQDISAVKTYDLIKADDALIVPINTDTIAPFAPSFEFDASNVVAVPSVISITNHGLTTGIPVRYFAGEEENAVIGNLTEGGLYYVIRLNDNEISLANSLSEALALTAITFSDTGGATQENKSTLQCIINYDIDGQGKLIATVNGTGEIITVESDTGTVFFKSSTAFNVPKANGKVFVDFVEADGVTPIVTDIELSAISEQNSTAQFDISVPEEETVSLVTDIIEPFLNVQMQEGTPGNEEDIGNSDYGMSGEGAENLDTPLIDAFTPIEVKLGRVNNIVLKNQGFNYVSDVRAIIRQANISAFDFNNIIINFRDVGFNISVGDVITQTRNISTFASASAINYTSKAEFLGVIGNDYYFKKVSFYGFDQFLPIVVGDREFSVVSIREDDLSRVMGSNAVIDGDADFLTGQIETVSIDKSGYIYEDGEIVEIYRSDGDPLPIALARVTVDAIGKGGGSWKTKTSFLSEVSRAIHDNDYYQEYSYEISSTTPREEYERIVKDNMEVAGTKLFSSSLINTNNIVSTNLDVELQVFDITNSPFIVDDNRVYVGGADLDGYYTVDTNTYSISTGELVEAGSNLVATILTFNSDITVEE